LVEGGDLERHDGGLSGRLRWGKADRISSPGRELSLLEKQEECAPSCTPSIAQQGMNVPSNPGKSAPACTEVHAEISEKASHLA
jgi:hypothetical protein